MEQLYLIYMTHTAGLLSCLFSQTKTSFYFSRSLPPDATRGALSWIGYAGLLELICLMAYV